MGRCHAARCDTLSRQAVVRTVRMREAPFGGKRGGQASLRGTANPQARGVEKRR